MQLLSTETEQLVMWIYVSHEAHKWHLSDYPSQQNFIGIEAL